MKKHLNIGFLLLLFYSSADLFPQEKNNLSEVVSQDDLGNVTDAFQEKFFEALKQKAIENHEKAIDALLECLELDSSEPVVYLELGKNYNALEKFNQAARYLERAREEVPGNEAVLAQLYKTYYLSQEFQKALPVVEELSEINTTFSEDLANLYLLNERYQEALDVLDSLDEEWGQSEYRNGLRRQVYAHTDDLDGKITDLERRIVKNPRDEQNYLNLIFIYSENGKAEKAFETAKELQQANPSSELVHLALYKFYLDEKATEKALESMRVLLKSRDLDEGTKYKVLNDFLIFVAEDPSLERDLIEMVEVFSKDENNMEVYGQLGTFFQEKNDLEEALKYFELGLENNDDDFGLIVKTLLLQLEFEQFEKVADLSTKAIENFPAQPMVYLISGTALNQLSSYEEAKNVLNNGLGFLIDDMKMEAGFYEQLSIAYAGLNNEKKAAESKSKAVQLKNSTIDE